MGLRDRFERAIGLGVGDEPRKLSVGRRGRRIERPLVSTPGARVRIVRDGRDGGLALALLLCHRNGVPVELAEGPNALYVDGRPCAPEELRKRIRELAR